MIETRVRVDVPGLDASECSQVVWEALREWDRVCGIGFKPGNAGLTGLTIVTGQPMIDGLPSRRHASSHSGWPAFGGEIRINPAYRWTAAALRRVVMHEVGHFMGREHSDDPQSIMYPDPQANSLSAGDVERAVKIWGEAE